MITKDEFISVLFHQQQGGLSIPDFCENEGYNSIYGNNNTVLRSGSYR